MSTVIENNVIPLYINSADRIDVNDSTTDFTIRLYKTLRNISTLTVSEVVIPRNDTVINPNNNTLEGNVDIDGVLTDFSITLTNGNYTETTLAAELKTQLDAAEITSTFGFTWSVSYDSATQRMLISLTYPQGATLNSWGFDILYTAIVDVLGLGDAGTTTRSFKTSLNDGLTITTGRAPVIQRALLYNITSTALTNSINTSYVSSVAKSFNIDTSNNTIQIQTTETITDQNYRVARGTNSLLQTSLRNAVISDDGNIIATASDDGVYVFNRTLVGGFWLQRIDPVTGTDVILFENEFGPTSVAISGDGNTMAVGIGSDNNRAGAVWIFTRLGLNWAQQAKLTGTGGVSISRLGTSVALSADGNTLVTGGFTDNFDTGAAWVFVRTGTSWAQEGPKLVKTGVSRYFGISIAVSADGNTMAVGGLTTGDVAAVWVLFRTAGVWAHQSNLLTGSGGGTIGAIDYASVSISDDGDNVALGGPNDASDAGAVWVFVRTGVTWAQQDAKIAGSAGDNFGYGVAIEGDNLHIGAPGDSSDVGLVWLYTRSGATWSQDSSFTGTGFEGSPRIGESIATNGTLIAVSGPADNNLAGATWVFDSGVQQGLKLVGTGRDGIVAQGVSLDVSRDQNIMVVSSIDDGIWTYERSGSTWNQLGEKLELITAIPDRGNNASLLLSEVFERRKNISVSDDGTIMAYAEASFNSDQGRVRIYNRTAAVWTEEITFTGVGTDRFGTSISLSGDGTVLLVGSPGDNSFWIYEKSTVWSAGVQISPGLGGDTGDAVSISQDGTTAFVGAPNVSTVTIYQKNITWDHQQTIVESGRFGYSLDVSTDGKTLAVGDRIYPGGGAVLVYRYTTTWTLEDTLTANDGTGAQNKGYSVSVSADGNRIITGAPTAGTGGQTGAWWIWTYSSGAWTRTTNQLIDSTGFGYQGNCVVMFEDGKAACVGAPFDGGTFVNATSGKGAVFFRVIEGDYDNSYDITIPSKVHTVFDLVNLMNVAVGLFTLNASFDGVNKVTLTLTDPSNISSIFTVGGTFTDIVYPSTKATTQESLEIDMTINNNIIKSIASHYDNNDNVIWDNKTSLIERKYKAGFTLESDDPIDIQLRDERDRIISLQGANWVMTVFATIHT